MLLHLLALDPRFTCASKYVCFAPHHFLLTESWLREEFDLLAPMTRPMDDPPLTCDEPREDECALMCLGAPSPYAAIAYPGQGWDMAARIRDEETDQHRARRWNHIMRWLVRALTYRERKRIILKSPPHTFRVMRLLEMYPTAQFVLITREPLATIASTVAMWKVLCRTQSLGPIDVTPCSMLYWAYFMARFKL